MSEDWVKPDCTWVCSWQGYPFMWALGSLLSWCPTTSYVPVKPEVFPNLKWPQHIRSAPYHPSSNGQAERFVQTMKRSLKASRNDGRSLSHRLTEFLLSYRTTPHATTNSSSGELFLKCSLWTRFDLLRSPTKGFAESKQAEQKQHHDRRSNPRCLFSGSQVKVRNYHGDTKWILGTILKKLGPVTYSVDIRDGRTVNWHIDQLCQSVHHSPKSTPNAINDYHYYEPVTPVQDVGPVQRTPPPRPLEEERRIDPVPWTPPPRLLEEEQRYPRWQNRLPERFIHVNY